MKSRYEKTIPFLRLLIKNIKLKQKYNIIAIIQSSGRVLSIGTNCYDRKSYPLKIKSEYGIHQGLHAELDAILKCKDVALRKASITVLGIGKGGSLVLSKPCVPCMKVIKMSGIRKVKYHNKKGDMETIIL